MFSKSSITDKHIITVISHISKESGMPEKEIYEHIADDMKKIKDLETKSKILYETIAENYIESTVFNLLQDHKVHVDGAPKFSTILFTKLFRRIRVENSSLFPLRNFVDPKALEPRIVFVPDAKGRAEKFESVDTACATPDGEFVFNTEFMQYLLNFAHLKELKPKGAKYECNGGDIPNEYSYIEFLIKHELYHYSYADFHYQKALNGDSKIINWVGDFRSNYDLVKSGTDQLPIGLYSKHVNYDTQKTYKEMYDLVKSEMDKLTDKERKDVEDMMDGMTDSHQDTGESSEGSPNNESDSGKDDKNDKAGKDDKDASDEAKKGKKPSKIDGKTAEDIEENEKRVQAKAGKSKEVGKEVEDAKNNATGRGPGSRGYNPGSGGRGDIAVDYSKFTPRYSWKQLLKKLVTTSDSEVDTTYQKAHRRNVTNTHIIASTGAGAIKPAEIPIDKNSLKLVIVEDSSGSMSDEIEKIHVEIKNLVKANSSMLSSFAIVKFSSGHENYVISFKGKSTGVYWKVDDLKKIDFKNLNGSNAKPFEELLRVHFSGGTEFDGAVVTDINHLLASGFNALIISDDDLTAGANLENIKSMIKKHKRQIYVMMKDKQSFSSMCKALQEVSQNVTHF